MDTRGIAGKDDYICTSIKELLYTQCREMTDLISIFSSVWSMVSIHLEYHLDIWKSPLKFRKYYLSTKS
jgi:hypothetical protein